MTNEMFIKSWVSPKTSAPNIQWTISVNSLFDVNALVIPQVTLLSVGAITYNEQGTRIEERIIYPEAKFYYNAQGEVMLHVVLSSLQYVRINLQVLTPVLESFSKE